MSRWFSFGTAKEAEPQTTRALPASWYRSSAMYELERRAIFSKKWIVVSHKARFTEVGDYLRITQAGFTFFLIKDRQGEIRAHHNVCRHRAFPLVEQVTGRVNILSCKYHGTLIYPAYGGEMLNSQRLVLWTRWQIGQGSKIPRGSDIR